MGANSVLANPPVLLIFVALIGANYGANLAVFPALMKVFYGPKNLATNYGIAYTAWGLGGFMVSQLASTIKDATGSFDNAYLLAAAMLILAAGLTISLKSPQAKKAAADKLRAQPIAAD